MNNDFLKKVKNIIIIIVVLLSIIFICLVILNNIKKEKNTYDPNYTVGLEKRNTKQVDINEEYFPIKNCIEIYYSKINSFIGVNKNNDIENKTREKIKDTMANSMLDILNKQYVEEFKITKENIISFFEEKNEDLNFIIDNMYVYDKDDNISIYVVYGKEISENNSEKSGFIVEVDRKDETFSIIPYEYLLKKGWDDISNIDYSMLNFAEIKINDNNEFSQQRIDDEDVAINIFQDYKNKIQYDIDSAYEVIDTEYKAKRFNSSIKEYKEYIKKINNILKNNKLAKIRTTWLENEQQTEYICMDIYGNYFIFKGNITQYSVLLDTYTIEIDEFKEEYQKADEAKKVALNLEKFQQMINGKDYESAYYILDENFRNDKFGTLENFIYYIEENWFECNKFSYDECEENDGIYIIKVSVVNAIQEDDNSKSIPKTFAMKIKNKTDFVISFNVD